MEVARTVVIDCFPESIERHRGAEAIVAIDVIRATTSAVTAVAAGRRCFPAPSIESAAILATRLPNPLLVGELGGSMPYGFDLTNSPEQIAELEESDRPMILLSTAGTRLMCEARESQTMYIACLRNFRAQAEHLARHHREVVLIGAGARGEFREEDVLCCAWIARLMTANGFEAGDDATVRYMEEWADAPADLIRNGNSARYLCDTGQDADLEFVLSHIDDLTDVYVFHRGEIVSVREAARAA